MFPCLSRLARRVSAPAPKTAEAMASVMLDCALQSGTCTAFDLRRAGFTDDDIAELGPEARAHAQAEAVRRNLADDLNLDLSAAAPVPEARP